MRKINAFILSAGSLVLLAGNANAAPALNRVSPGNGATRGGTPITIFGSDFGAVQGTIRVGNQDCPVTTWEDTRAICTVPEGAGAQRAVMLSVPDATGSTTTAGGIAYSYDPPAIDSISPATAPPTGNVRLTISGSNFGPVGVAAVSVGSASCPVASGGTHEQLLCDVPAGTGAVPVKVDVAGQAATSSQSLTYAVPPAITSINPGSGATQGGYVITITGNNFGGGSSVRVAGQVCPTVMDSDTEVQCTMPPGQGSHAAVELVTTKGARGTYAPGFSFGPPQLDLISASSVRAAGGTPLTLTGSNFGVSSVVSIGTSSCPITEQGHSLLICTTPPGVGAQKTVTVTAGDQTSTQQRTLSYNAPSITSVSPATARTAGGIIITIEGADFSTRDGAVTVGGEACPMEHQADERVTCTVPPGVGAVASVVVSVGGQQGSSAAFGYLPPSITGITPSTGAAEGGTLITITGDNFGASGAKVHMGASQCPVVEMDHTQLTCTSPSGSGQVEVAVEAGGQRSQPSMFTYEGAAASSSSSAAASSAGASSGGETASSSEEGASSREETHSSSAPVGSSSSVLASSSSHGHGGSSSQSVASSSSNGSSTGSVSSSVGGSSSGSEENDVVKTEAAICRCVNAVEGAPLSLLLLALVRRRRR